MIERMSTKGLVALMREEGVALGAYRDSVGVWTIGVGHTRAAGRPYPRPGMVITLAEAIKLFRRDIRKYERAVAREFKGHELRQHEFDAAVIFHYNTGAIHKASWVEALKRRDMAEVRRRFLWWKKPLAILPRRRRTLKLLLRGDYGNLSKVLVYTKPNRRGAKRMNPWPLLKEMEPPPEARRKLPPLAAVKPSERVAGWAALLAMLGAAAAAGWKGVAAWFGLS